MTKSILALLVSILAIASLAHSVYLTNQIIAINNYNNGLSLALARLTKRVIALEKK